MKNRYIFTGKRTLACQRGAIGVLGALVLAMGVLFMALSVDSGRLYLEQQRLQKIADTAALDASRALCGAAAADLAEVSAAAQASALRNGYGGDLSAEVGSVQVGNTNRDAAGLRQFTGAALASATAVQVTARNTVLRSLVAGGWWGGTTTLSAMAVASDEAIAGFSAGSFLARLELPPGSGILNPLLNPLLNGVLGAGLGLDLLSYKGIAAADVTLRGLIEAHGGVGKVNELLALNMDVADFLALTATALSNQGDAAAAATLNSIAASVTSPDALTLGDLLKVTTEDPETALDAKVNVMDLLMGSAQVANGTNAVTIEVAIPGVAGVTLRLIEPPQIAIGPAGKDADGNWKTQVKTAQMRLGVELDLPDIPPILGVSINVGALGLAVEAAQTTAALERIDCPRYTAPEGRATVKVQPGIAGLALGALNAAGNVTGPSTVASLNLKLLGITLLDATISASADVDVASPGESLEFSGPFPADAQTVGTELGSALATALDNLLLDLDLDLDVNVLGLGRLALLNSVVNSVSGILNGALGLLIPRLADELLTPLLSALGVTLGGADIQVFALEGEQPHLRI